MTKLRIADNLLLPKDAVTQTLVVYGGKGMGKTNFCGVFAEELSGHGLRFALLDPLGVNWGLRYSEDGKGPGIECLILGGVHGDIPIEPTGGVVVADLVADEDVNTIIDISRRPNGTMWGSGERIRFVADYAARLFERQGEARRPVMQIIDEAGRFVPQVIPHGSSDVSRCVGALEQLVEWGRNVGVGVCLITQRSARMNKSVSELAQCMIAFNPTGPRNLDAIMDWLGEHIEKKRWQKHVEALRKLQIGEALVVSPAWLRFEGVVTVRKRCTFDSSATPKPGQSAEQVRGKGAQPDLGMYQQRMAATIERAKADDPKELRRQIAELKKANATATKIPDQSALEQAKGKAAKEAALRFGNQVASLSKWNAKLRGALEVVMKFLIKINADGFAGKVEPPLDQEAMEKSIKAAVREVSRQLEARLEGQRRDFETWRKEGAKLLRSMEALLQSGEVPVEVSVRHNQPFTVTPHANGVGKSTSRKPTSDAPVPEGREQLTPTECIVLDAAASFPGGATRQRISIFSGRSIKSSSFQAAFSNGVDKDGNPNGLVSKGILRTNGDRYQPTEAGALLAMPTVGSSLEDWKRKLVPSEAKVLQCVADAFPERLTREEVSERTGQSIASSSFNAAFPALRALELIEGSRDFRLNEDLASRRGRPNEPWAWD